MPVELKPGVPTAVFARRANQGTERGAKALTELALAVERAVKLNLRKGGTHKYGTPTPATPGGPPALISGTLRRSVTVGYVERIGSITERRIGPANGFYPPYGGAKRTPAARYGEHLEKGLRGGVTYPWLIPAFRLVVETLALRIYHAHYGGDWRRL